MRANFTDKKIEILEKYSKKLKGFIENESIDKILLINVIYFLSPLEEYPLEFNRILKGSGIILITGKFSPASKIDQSVFANTDLDGLRSILNNYFEVL